MAVLAAAVLIFSLVVAGSALYSFYNPGPQSSLGPLQTTAKTAAAQKQPTPTPVVIHGVINTTDTVNESRREKDDQIRLSDLAALQKLLNAAAYGYMVGDVLSSTNMCANISDNALPCFGSSLTNGVNLDGSGWVKADLRPVLDKGSLPVDPINTKAYHYSYCATRTQWEIETVLESVGGQDKMKNDGGQDPNKFEIGTNLSLFSSQGKCKY